MKAVASSIGLVALVAFGGLLLLPCFSFQSAYMQLDAYLTESAHSGSLRDNVEAAWRILEYEEEFDQLSPEFQDLVNAFGFLLVNRQYPSFLCHSRILENLHFLITAALKGDKTLTGPHKDANRLNRLLRELKDRLRTQCYRFFHMTWSNTGVDSRKAYFADVDATLELGFINRRVSFDALRRRITYFNTPSNNTPSEVKREFEEIIVGLFYERYRSRDSQEDPDNKKVAIVSENLTKDRVEEELKRLFEESCKNILGTSLAVRLFEPLVQVLEMEAIHFPGEKELPNFKLISDIESLPAYVICRELDWKLKILEEHRKNEEKQEEKNEKKNRKNHEDIIADLLKALLQAARTRRMKLNW